MGKRANRNKRNTKEKSAREEQGVKAEEREVSVLLVVITNRENRRDTLACYQFV
jgi:hypothetical protein